MSLFMGILERRMEVKSLQSFHISLFSLYLSLFLFFFLPLTAYLWTFSSLFIIKETGLKGMTFDHDFCYFILIFFLPLILKGMRKEEKNNQSRGQKSCHSVWSLKPSVNTYIDILFREFVLHG